MAAALTVASTNANGETLSVDAAVGAAASMAAASPQSSVASAADLASIGPGESAPPAEIPTELLAAAERMPSAELLSATVESPDA
jgi:hypothetical protein